jgi:hypothetical protein
MKTTKIAIKLNNCCDNPPCAICGERTDPEAGPELFLADSWAVVCPRCAEKHDPVIFNIWAKFKRRCFIASLFQDCRYDGDQYVREATNLV